MIVFLDLETTGLNPNKDIVLEVGAIFTDDRLLTIHEFHSVLYASVDNPQRKAADSVVQLMHNKNGLWEESEMSSHTASSVDYALSQIIYKYGMANSQLAGNSVHFDRAFMSVHLPESLRLLSHRQIDISSLNEMSRRFCPELYANRPKSQGSIHRALEDARESLRYARWYRDNLFGTAEIFADDATWKDAK